MEDWRISGASKERIYSAKRFYVKLVCVSITYEVFFASPKRNNLLSPSKTIDNCFSQRTKVIKKVSTDFLTIVMIAFITSAAFLGSTSLWPQMNLRKEKKNTCTGSSGQSCKVSFCIAKTSLFLTSLARTIAVGHCEVGAIGWKNMIFNQE